MLETYSLDFNTNNKNVQNPRTTEEIELYLPNLIVRQIKN